MSRKAIVVADEKKAETKIPYVCEKLSVKCIDKFGLFSDLGIKY